MPNQQLTGLCEDIWCEDPTEATALTRVRYIESNKGPALICEGCRDGWMEALDEYLANRADFDLGGYPVVFRTNEEREV